MFRISNDVQRAKILAEIEALKKQRDNIEKSKGKKVADLFWKGYQSRLKKYEQQIEQYDKLQRKEKKMHYRNGRDAKNGDKIVKLNGGKIESLGVLYDAEVGNDYCNGRIAPIQPMIDGACLVDSLRIDDIEAMIKEKGLDKRPEGK